MNQLDQLNPDWQMATTHGLASKVGYTQKSGQNVNEVCQCCFQIIQKEQIPICVSTKELEILGFGFPLFYSFLKNCIILLIILICSYSILSLKKAVENNYDFCHSSANPEHRMLSTDLTANQPICTTFMINIARIEDHADTDEEIVRIASFILQLLFLIYMRDHLTKLESYYDQRNTSLSDYSIMLKRLPKQPGIQSKLKNFFESAFCSPHEIKQLTILPEYPEIEELKIEKSKVINLLREAYNRPQMTQQDINNQAYLATINEGIKTQAFNSMKLAQKDQLLCEKAILVFNTDEEKSTIIQEFNDMSLASKEKYFGPNAENIRIKEAPEPKEIIWENVNVSQSKKIGLYVMGWAMSLGLLILATIIFYLILQQKSLFLLHSLQNITKYKENPKTRSQYYSAIALTFFMLFLVIIFNKVIMSTLFYKFTELQRHDTTSKFQFSFGLKYLLGLFFTTALMTLAVEAIRFNNYYSHPYGVIEEETIMFFLNALFTPLFWLFNPFSLGRIIKRYFSYGKKTMTQQQANHLMENSHYDGGKRYAEITQTIWFTFLYATLIPIGAFISLCGAIIYFWVDKYTLLRKSSLGREISGKIVITNMKLIDFTLVLKPAGELMFDMQMRKGPALVSSIVMLVIGFLYFLAPVGKIINYFNPQQFNLEDKTYEEMKEKIKDTYHTEHPVVRIIFEEKLRKKIERTGVKVSIKIPKEGGQSLMESKSDGNLVGLKPTTSMLNSNIGLNQNTNQQFDNISSLNKLYDPRQPSNF